MTISLHCTAGSGLADNTRRRLVNRIAELTGLSPAFVEEKNLRVADHDFFFELLRDEGKIVGRLDARVTGTDGRQPHTLLGIRSGDGSADAAPYRWLRRHTSRSLGMPGERRYDVFGKA